MRTISKWVIVVSLVAGLFGFAVEGTAGVLRQVTVSGARYDVDLVTSGSTAAVWFRPVPDAKKKTGNPIQALGLSVQKMKLKDAGAAVCRAKSVIDRGRMIAGCAAAVGTGLCAAAAVPTAGTDSAVCSAVVLYTVNTGFADCLYGLSDEIAARLGREREWNAVRLQAALSSGQMVEAIDKSIDIACADVRR